MNEMSAALGGEGEKAPEIAAPAENIQPGSAAPEEDSGRRHRSEDAKYAAARRKAEAERDTAIAQMQRERSMEQAETQKLRRSLAEDQKSARDVKARLVAEEQIRQIGQIDGAVTSMEELLAMPEYDDFYALVKKGMSLTEAYKIVHYDRLLQRQADLSARQTVQSVAFRQHMTALAGGTGSGDYVSVPAEVAAQFRLAKPGITDAEIRKKYRKYQKYKRQ